MFILCVANANRITGIILHGDRSIDRSTTSKLNIYYFNGFFPAHNSTTFGDYYKCSFFFPHSFYRIVTETTCFQFDKLMNLYIFEMKQNEMKSWKTKRQQ